MIESLANEQVKKVVKWKKNAKARREDGIFLVEGPKMTREAAALGLARRVYVTEEFLRKEGKIVKDIPAGMLMAVSPAVFAQMSDTVTPQGILCVTKCPSYSLSEILKKEELSLLVLEDVQDPGNVGTMLRTAEAAGVDAVILSRGCADILSPKVVRSTMGAIFRLPFFVAEDFFGSLLELKQAGICFYAAHLQGTKEYQEESFGKRTAILIGNESKGLTREVSELADVRVKIPMCGKVESLNASVAAALLMYERRYPHEVSSGN